MPKVKIAGVEFLGSKKEVEVVKTRYKKFTAAHHMTRRQRRRLALAVIRLVERTREAVYGEMVESAVGRAEDAQAAKSLTREALAGIRKDFGRELRRIMAAVEPRGSCF